jgi:hypothetical protein
LKTPRYWLLFRSDSASDHCTQTVADRKRSRVPFEFSPWSVSPFLGLSPAPWDWEPMWAPGNLVLFSVHGNQGPFNHEMPIRESVFYLTPRESSSIPLCISTVANSSGTRRQGQCRILGSKKQQAFHW